jgi:hypothetical protein
MSKKIFVWMPTVWGSWEIAKSLGIDLIPDAVVNTGYFEPSPDIYNKKEYIKRVAICAHTEVSTVDTDNQSRFGNLHLHWADCLITYSTEFPLTWWPQVYSDICLTSGTDKIACVFDGFQTYSIPPPDRFFCGIRSWFHWVAYANLYQEISTNTHPSRKYMFDALLGTAKPGRIPLLYNLLDSGLVHNTLINFQPNPFDDPWPQIKVDYADQYTRWGHIENYSSPEIAQLDIPEINLFKQQTQNQSARKRYLANAIDLGAQTQIHSVCMVPWNIYAHSWYSIVCETVSSGFSNRFLTEKTAKCLFAKRIFVMHCGGRLLEFLQQYGFKTFHGPYIDESYDQEEDDHKRYRMVWEQIERLSKFDPVEVYNYYQPVLDHNYAVFCELPKKQLLELQQFCTQAIHNL